MALPAPYYEDDFCTLYNADCRDVLPWLHPRDFVVVTDPPFNIGYHYAGYKDKMDEGHYIHLLRQTVCHEQFVLIHYPEDIFKVAVSTGRVPNRMVAWVYPSNTARQWRGIAWFGVNPDFSKESQPYKNPTDKRIKKLIAQGKQARLYDWWEVNQVKNVAKEKTSHPCQMPLTVMKRIVNLTPAPAIVDPFSGSGTTLVAAKMLGRRAVGIELDKKYCDVIVKRLQEV